ncbi:CAP domain-containing protein [Falsigemmobacter faecalis]|uniref:CAP domain-containing protein n=1 Tax=Falsigemmobacter faecalis TaxID=2488730 RepID=A0A3P3D4Q3_9RHOB|nr:CAP domain-containing protein [Falsigemmobacter faecalis]RRH69365.1 CAP domain-containing protein [Falsigemmobacter faecalis]
MRNWCLLPALALWALSGPAAAQNRCAAPPAAEVTQVFTDLNRMRAARGLVPLAPEPRLMQAAQAHACDNAARGGPSHQGRDGSSLGQRLQRAGYPYRTAAENIAYGRIAPSQVIGMWQGSAAHDRNLRNPAVTEAGIGIARNTAGQSAYVLKLAGR